MRRAPATSLLAFCLAGLLAACTASNAPTVTVTVTGAASPASASPSGTATDAFADARAAVYRIRTTNCTAGLEGVSATGFAISEHLVVTAAHAVEYQQDFQLTSSDGTEEGQVLGFDPQTDIALLWLQSTTSETLDFADTAAQPTQQVSLLGFPKGGDSLQVATATVTGVQGTGTVTTTDATLQRQGLLVLDQAGDAAESGAPVLDAQGRVVGVTSAQLLRYDSTAGAVEGSGEVTYAGQPAQFQDLIEKWRAKTSWVDSCDPDSINHVIQNLTTATGAGAAAAATLDTFWLTVNKGDYRGAWALLNANGKRVKGSLERWSEKLDGSEYSDGYLETVSTYGSTATVRAVVNLSEPSSDGLSTQCTVWRLSYRLTKESGKWLVGSFSGRRTGTC